MPRLVTGAALAIVASPLLVNPAGFDRYQLPKLVVLGLASVVGLTAAARLIPRSGALVALASLVGVMALAAIASGSPWTALLGGSSRRFGVAGWAIFLAAFVVGGTCAPLGRTRLLLRWTLFVGVAVATLVVLQRIGFDPLRWSHVHTRRPTGTFGSAALTGAYLSMAASICFAQVVTKAVDRRRYLPVMGLLVVGVALTQARAAWVGLTIAVVLTAVVSSRRLGMDRSDWQSLGAIALVGIAVVVAAPGLPGRAASTFRTGDGTAAGRIDLWAIGVDASIQRPLLGWGPDQSRVAIERNLTPEFEPDHGDATVPDRAHNVFIDVAIWAGLTGCLIFIAFVVCVVRSAFLAREPEHLRDRLPIVTALCAVFCHLLFNFPTGELDVHGYLLAGLLVVGVGPTSRREPARLAGIAVGALLLVPTAAWIREVPSDRALSNAVSHENRGNLVAAERSYRQAANWAPRSTRYAEARARFLLRHGQAEAAVAVARGAVGIDPNDPYLSELHADSLAAWALASDDGDVARQAENIYRRLVAEAPNDGSLHLGLGNALAAQGRFAEAEQAYWTSARLLPQRSEPIRNVALLAEHRGDTGEARRLLELAVAIDPADSVARGALDRLTS